MILRFATWNMAAAFRGGNAAGWAFLDGLNLDIACVQEARPPVDRTNVIWKGRGRSRPWGSGVVGYQRVALRGVATVPVGIRLPPGAIEDSYPGAVAIAEVALAGGPKVTVVSMYGVFYKLANNVSYSTAQVHRMLSDLTPILDVKRSKRSVIIAGDWNMSPQFDAGSVNLSSQGVIDRLTAFGLVDCIGATHEVQPRTYRPANKLSGVPWQIDWIFASPSLEIVSCEPLDTEEAWAHATIVRSSRSSNSRQAKLAAYHVGFSQSRNDYAMPSSGSPLTVLGPRL